MDPGSPHPSQRGIPTSSLPGSSSMFAVDEASNWKFHFGSKCDSFWLNICCFIYYLGVTGEAELIWVLQMGISSVCGDCLSMDPEARGTSLPPARLSQQPFFSTLCCDRHLRGRSGHRRARPLPAVHQGTLAGSGFPLLLPPQGKREKKPTTAQGTQRGWADPRSVESHLSPLLSN